MDDRTPGQIILDLENEATVLKQSIARLRSELATKDWVIEAAREYAKKDSVRNLNKLLEALRELDGEP